METIIKEWGTEVILVRDECYCAKILEIAPGKISSLHRHLKKRETFIVIDGSGYFQHELGIYRFDVGDRLTVGATEWHRFWSEDGMKLLEVSTHDDPEDNERQTYSGDIRTAENIGEIDLVFWR